MADIADYSWEVSAHAYLPRFDNVRNSNSVYWALITFKLVKSVISDYSICI